MKFEDSQISKELTFTVKELPFGKLYFFPKFIISEMDYGIHLDWAKIEKVIKAIFSHYGMNCKIGYISNKVNSYSFEPTLWTKFYKNYDFIIASVSVCYSHINYINATLEKQFSKKSVKRTDNIKDSIKWITNLKEFNV
ncbi:hypothetical protein [Lacinutrix jangbogonensis]|uniref:hypothetical protein n=1 Tax=Lacinutrix jangbogonensis TaxID=1469557 RepID=UPI00053D22A5|nr:hypothetical protein [Lacinutrix jangbogonensis]